MRLKLIELFALCSLSISMGCYAFDDIKLDAKSALFTAVDKSVPVVTTKYIGWAENWVWAGARVKPDQSGKMGGSDSAKPASSFRGEFHKLGVGFQKTFRREKDKLTWSYVWDKKMDYPDAMGIGVEFNLKLDSPGFGSLANAPELLAGNKGWRWTTPDGQSLEVDFSPAVAKLYFERGKPHKIRALFFESITQGSAQTTMTVTVSGNRAISLNAAKTSNGEEDNVGSWHKDILSDEAVPVDLSFLNAGELPAGKHGFVKAQGDQLVFEDGTPARFWGTNVMAFALFSSSDNEIQAHAKRIAKLGFNLVRIHHHDSGWVKPNIFANPSENTQELSGQSLKKLDWWIKCLKEEGVYVWLDLHVGRAFTSQDGIENFDELTQAKGNRQKYKDTDSVQAKGFNYFNESIQKQMQAFNKAYLTHVNTFTGRSYKDDPAIIALLITNENDLTQHFGNLLLPNKGVPEHNALFTRDFERFSEASGFKSKKAGRAWDYGEPKLFLAEAEHRFNQTMISHLRGLGVKSMIATTSSWGKMGLSGLPSLTDGNLVDAHSYGVAEELSFDPHYYPGFLTWIGAAQVTGKPLSATEWNIEPFPTDDRFVAPIATASIADLQGWDAMMLYGYSQVKLDKNLNGGNYSTYNDPAITGMMPAAALLYRQNHVAPAKNVYAIKLSPEDFYYKKQDPTTSKTIRTLLETSRFSITVPEIKALPWLKSGSETARGVSVITDPNQDFIPAKQNFVQSDTGELKRDWQKGVQTVDSAKSQIASGRIGGENIKLQDTSFNIATRTAVVSVQSLDGHAIKKSKNIFITAMARSTPIKEKKLPFLSEPVRGEISIAAPEGLKLYPVNRLGEKGKPAAASFSRGAYHIKLDDQNDSHWFFLSAVD